ncbi:hypothetical protein [Dyadobacter psychrotolerans]|uniref:Uncharacterized protein n=1 Tax=Dyadobacter psychrotolerans TaxID=2541721 RepID=A0A4R5DKG7_9BACT|nr:hypothetical protein [Dyadobacter psychrotolerans]TDE14666.1 hypothetical protein E0F88_15875 [Dyadobacter psychrotolerans]
MKKSVIYIGIFSLLLTGGAFAQKTTISTNPNESTRDTTKQRTTTGARKTNDGTHQPANSKVNTATQQGRATNAGAATKNADGKVSKGGVVGNSGASAQAQTSQSSPATSPPKKTRKETINISQGPINKTQPDSEVKKGSGSAPKNTKNKTGKTGNYQNEATKKDNGN